MLLTPGIDRSDDVTNPIALTEVTMLLTPGIDRSDDVTNPRH